jgi:hypothetical protein
MNEYYERTDQIYQCYYDKGIEKAQKMLKDTIKQLKHYPNCNVQTITKY